MYDQKLKILNKFLYLGNTTNIKNLDDEISLRIKKANNAFGTLDGHIWSRHGISIEIKLMAYNTSLMNAESLTRDR